MSCFSPQGSGRGAVPEPDGAAGGALRGAGGADADGAVPHAPGHHGMGVLGALRRPAQRTPLRGTAPAQVGHLLCAGAGAEMAFLSLPCGVFCSSSGWVSVSLSVVVWWRRHYWEGLSFLLCNQK